MDKLVLSSYAKAFTNKFVSRRESPYEIVQKLVPACCKIALSTSRSRSLGVYNISTLKTAILEKTDTPIWLLKKELDESGLSSRQVRRQGGNITIRFFLVHVFPLLVPKRTPMS